MALTSTLFTGLSGLDVNQARLNVVGNNIANVNTVAYKASRALFKPQFYVTDSGGSPSSDTFGGTNPSQRGLGAVVASIEKNFAPGALEPTGKATDMAIDGDGFFIVRGADEQKYTRDGSFVLNDSNQLVTTAGDFLQGYGVDDNGNVILGRLDNVVVPLGTATNAKPTETVELEGNLNAAGDTALGATILNTQPLALLDTAVGVLDDSTPLVDVANASDNTTALFAAGQTLTLKGAKGGRDLATATLTIDATTTVGDLAVFFNEALGTDTTLADDGDLSTPEPGAGLKLVGGNLVFTVIGNRGEENAISLSGTAFTNGGGSPFIFGDGADENGVVSGATGESVNTSFVVYDSLGTPLTVELTAVLESKSDDGNTWRFFAHSADDTDRNLLLGSGTLTFDTEGRLLGSADTAIQIDRADTGASAMTVQLDFGAMTSLTSRTSELVMTGQDGSPIGKLNNFSIGADGTITGQFSNGLTQTLGQIALATFNNPQGLIDKGGNMYVSGSNSGVPIVTSPLALGSGAIRAGALELSNVDLSEEFINLIISSTGFSASSRVITTSDQLLTELLNTSR